jgi:hypothetical protein
MGRRRFFGGGRAAGSRPNLGEPAGRSDIVTSLSCAERRCRILHAAGRESSPGARNRRVAIDHQRGWRINPELHAGCAASTAECHDHASARRRPGRLLGAKFAVPKTGAHARQPLNLGRPPAGTLFTKGWIVNTRFSGVGKLGNATRASDKTAKNGRKAMRRQWARDCGKTKSASDDQIGRSRINT